MKNKCEYCNCDNDGFGKPWSDKEGTYTTYICFNGTDNTYYLETETNFGSLAVEENVMCETANIEHCPKCGRKLTVEN